MHHKMDWLAWDNIRITILLTEMMRSRQSKPQLQKGSCKPFAGCITDRSVTYVALVRLGFSNQQIQFFGIYLKNVAHHGKMQHFKQKSMRYVVMFASIYLELQLNIIQMCGQTQGIREPHFIVTFFHFFNHHLVAEISTFLRKTSLQLQHPSR